MIRTIVMAFLFATAAMAQTVEERITVERVIIDAHVIRDDGSPIKGLQPADFRVRFDGKPAEIESLEWVEAGTAYPEGPSVEEAYDSNQPLPPKGRLLVMYFQTDFGRASERVRGQMKMTAFAMRFLDTLLPDDRVAVVSFDSHLKLRQDFTSDRSMLEFAIKEALKINEPPPPQLVPSPALFSRIDPKAAREATSSEQALLLIGNALIPIAGPKTMVMFGWGLGDFVPGIGVLMTHDYIPAKRALESARTSVFVLDISEADYHTLEAGLKVAAKDTGGFYQKTYLFPQMAMDRLEKAISGYYVLVVKRPPELKPGVHKIEVDVKKRGASVLARTTFVD